MSDIALKARKTARPTGRASAAVLAFALLLLVAIPMLLVLETDQARPLLSPVVISQAVVLAYAAIRLLILFSRGRPNWLELVFWGYSYTWFGVAPLAQAIAGQNPLRVQLADSTLIGQALVVLVGFAAYDLGSLLAGAFHEPNPRLSTRMLSTRRVALVSVASLALTPAFVTLQGGLAALFSSRADRTDALETSGLYSDSSKAAGAWVSSIASVAPFVSLYGLIAAKVNNASWTKLPTYVLVFCLTVVANVVLNNPISTSRFWFIVVALSLIFLVPASVRPTGVRSITAVFVLASTFAFPYLDFFRTSGSTLVLQSASQFFVAKTDFDSLAQVGNAVDYVNNYGVSLGAQLLGSALFFVPRSLWESKPIDSGSLLANYINYPNANLSGPLWAEFYLNFGAIGVFIGFLLYGGVSAMLFRRYSEALRVNLAIWSGTQVFFPVIALYQVLILRGSLLQAMGRLVVLLAVLYAITEKRSEARASHQASRTTWSAGPPVRVEQGRDEAPSSSTHDQPSRDENDNGFA